MTYVLAGLATLAMAGVCSYWIGATIDRAWPSVGVGVGIVDRTLAGFLVAALLMAAGVLCYILGYAVVAGPPDPAGFS